MLSVFFIAAAVIFSISMLAGCESGKQPEQASTGDSALEQTQQELEQIKQDSTKLDQYITDLKKEINTLKIENQRLVAQTKRLEAEIIDLKLDLGQVPDADSADMLDKDAEPAADSGSTPAPGSPAH
jgi:septal ring factor EnvC (AmiA/AmiB activator)